MAKVKSVNTSPERGTGKVPVEVVLLVPGRGIEGDGHAGPGSRQVSILAWGSLEKMRTPGLKPYPGCCGENIDVDRCVELYSILPGTVLAVGERARLRITGIGKDNSDGHADRVIRGNVFPKEGAFAEVLTGGEVRPGDTLNVPRTEGFTAAVLTVSDSASRGDYPDESGPAVMNLLNEAGYTVVRYYVEPDEPGLLESRIAAWCDDGFTDVLFTVGGTGMSVRDITPEVTSNVCSRDVPGIPELMRLKSSEITSAAWLSRARCGIRERTLVVNLPGSVKASVECAGFVLPVLDHALEILRGDVAHCGSSA